jgi:hypothetical protein
VLHAWQLFKSNQTAENRLLKTNANRVNRPNAQAKMDPSSGWVEEPVPKALPSQIFDNNVSVGSSISGETKYLSGVCMLSLTESRDFTRHLYQTIGITADAYFNKELKDISADATETGHPGQINFDLLLEALTYNLVRERERRESEVEERLREYCYENTVSLLKEVDVPILERKKAGPVQPVTPSGFIRQKQYMSYNAFEKLVQFVDEKYPSHRLPHAYNRLVDETRKRLMGKRGQQLSASKRERLVEELLLKVLQDSELCNLQLRVNFHSDGYYAAGGTLQTGNDNNAQLDWELLNNVFYHRKPLIAKQHKVLHEYGNKKKYAKLSALRKKFMATLGKPIPKASRYKNIATAWQQYRQMSALTASAMQQAFIPDDTSQKRGKNKK